MIETTKDLKERIAKLEGELRDAHANVVDTGLQTNFVEEHDSLTSILEVATSSCIDMQNEFAAMNERLNTIAREKSTPLGAKIEADAACVRLQRAEWLLGYVREELKVAMTCFGMRRENGEM